LVLGAVLFFVILVAILRSAASGENRNPAKKEKKSKPIPQKQKQKRGRSSLKKSERHEERSEWVGVDSPAKDAEAVLEFLKGKDPAEIAKQHVTATKQATKKAKKAKEAVQESDESASESVASDEGFEEVKKNEPKKKKNDKKKEKKPEDQKEKAKRPFFKPLRPEDGGPPVEEQRKGRRDRNANTEGAGGAAGGAVGGAVGGAAGGAERKARPEGERAERKPRPEGERRKPRSEGEEKPARRPITSPPNVKYEEADLNDILNSITRDFKPPKEKTRIDSIFSNFPRHIVAQILAKLNARDLVALSEVNHYFVPITRRDALWRDLLARDFGVRDGKIKNFLAAYKREYKKRKYPRKEDGGVPQGEEKDRKAKGAKGFTKGNKREPVTEEAIAQQE